MRLTPRGRFTVDMFTAVLFGVSLALILFGMPR